MIAVFRNRMAKGEQVFFIHPLNDVGFFGTGVIHHEEHSPAYLQYFRNDCIVSGG
jgi:hypothetical protein